MTARINVIRPLCKLGNFPVFDFRLSVNGADYDLVLPNVIADQLRDYSCQEKHYRLDRRVGGDTPRDARSCIVRMTTSNADRNRLLYATLEAETEVGVYVDKLLEAATYSYLFASPAIAANLCADADTGKLPSALARYIRLHSLALLQCGGLELLVARFRSTGFGQSYARVPR